MRIIVVSDSHKNFRVLQKIVDFYPTADAFIHLGDGNDEFETLMALYPSHTFYCVKGNCDSLFSSNAEKLEIFDGKRVYYTHGHIHGVKHGMYNIIAAARGVKADVLLYGHTHIPMTGYQDGLYIMNPGTVSGAGSGKKTYGVLDITPAGIVTNIVSLDTSY